MTATGSSAPSAGSGRGVMGTVVASGWSLFAQIAASSLVINALSLGVPIFVLQVYDRVVPHAGFETLKGLFIGVVAVILFDFALRQSRGRLVQMIALRVDVDLSRRLFARLTGAPLADLEARTDVEWRRLLRDVDVVRDTVAGPTTLLTVDLPFAILFIAAIAWVAPPLAGLLLALTPIFLIVAFIASIVIGRSSAKEQTLAVDKGRLTEELVAGRGTAKALGLGPALTTRWETAQAAAIRASVVRGSDIDSFNHIGVAMMLCTTVLMTTVGAVAIVNQTMSIGGLIAANMLAARIVQPLTQAIGVWRGVVGFRESAKRLDAVLGLDVERMEPHVARPRPKGRLEFEGVAFAYDGARGPALDRLSIVFAPGFATGLVGSNGGGKSTLLKVAQGLYRPQQGRVLLDGADIAQFGRDELSRWIGYVPQEPFLCAGSIRENIARGRGDVDDEAIRRAAELASAAEFIADLPDGYGTDVGEGGRRLSPGHRQRVAIARALLDDPAILLFDEPSANLDFQAEQALCVRLQALKRSRCVVVVSHSRRLLEACDQIVVLRGGRVAMAGPSEDVLPRAAPPSAATRAVEETREGARTAG